ncbi:Hypothetical predicted protein, partial [Paramuricea clavata]
MADDLTKTRDYVYVICTLIQTLFAVFVWVWWERSNRNKDKKEDRRKEEAERQKADTKQIIAILSENYDEVEEIFQELKKSVDDLKERKITNTGSRTFTEFDVLLYMCHDDNCNKFDETPDQLLYVGICSARKKVMLDVNKIMTFIKNFAIQLSVIDKGCPDIIRLKFSTEIIEMGKTIYPFVTKTRQELIQIVLKYFGDTPAQEDRSPGCVQWCCQTRVSRCCHCSCVIAHEQADEPETERLASTPGPSNAVDIEMTGQPSANEGLIPYPGREAIENAIPYIESFKYENGKMICNLTCTISHIKNLEVAVEMGEIDKLTNVKISEEINTLWKQSYGSHLADDLLHLIRMIMFKLLKDSTLSLQQFAQSVKNIVNSPAILKEKVIICCCQRASNDIKTNVMHLNGAQKHLLKDKSTQVILERHAEELRKFVQSK